MAYILGTPLPPLAPELKVKAIGYDGYDCHNTWLKNDYCNDGFWEMIIVMMVFIRSVVGGARKAGDEPSGGEGRYIGGAIVLSG